MDKLPGSQAKYRMATVDDAEAIRDIAGYYINKTTYSWRYEVLDLASYEDMIRKHQKPNRPFWVATVDDKVVGYSSLSDFRAPEGYWPCAEDSVYVHPAYGRRGIGHRLMKLLIDSAREAKLQAVIAAIDAENKVSIDFHKQFGFYECGYMKKIAWKHNSFRDLVLMQLDLQNDAE